MNVDEFLPDDLEVQKAVVESLAADKAVQDEKLVSLEKENTALKNEIVILQTKLTEMKVALDNVGDLLAKNTENPMSSQVALLERNAELDDRFPGETHDQVIESLREARDEAEKNGRLRRAQILESVLVANEPVGTLAKNRVALEKLFTAHANVLTGPVLDELKKLGLSHKNGEEFLLPAEIIKRNY